MAMVCEKCGAVSMGDNWGGGPHPTYCPACGHDPERDRLRQLVAEMTGCGPLNQLTDEQLTEIDGIIKAGKDKFDAAMADRGLVWDAASRHFTKTPEDGP